MTTRGFAPEVITGADADSTPSRLNSRVNSAIPHIIDGPRIGSVRREMVTWKTPKFGYIQMYLNPKTIQIASAKVIQSQRTKGGYVIQYGGEKLDEINISGTTGSAGIEGINILQNIYRSEQVGFETVAVALEQELSNLQLDQFIGNFTNAAVGGATQGEFGFNINSLQIASRAFNGLYSPKPTLASLASQVEMFFQGVTYRGYFTKFSVDENEARPGLFEYTIGFTAYAKQGVRRNFLPWHKQPQGPAGTGNPMSFSQMDEGVNLRERPDPGEQTPTNSSPFSARVAATRTAASGLDGLNIDGLDLRQ